MDQGQVWIDNIVGSHDVNITVNISKPILSSPANVSTVTPNINFTWNGAINNYRLQVSTDRTFATTDVDANVLNNYYSNILDIGKTYYWRARYEFDSEWTDINEFNTTVNLTYPYNGSTISGAYPPLTSSINFTWSNANTNYNIVVAKDTLFNIITVDKVVTTNYSVESLSAGTYYWKVRIYNTTSGTYGSYTNANNFTLSLTSGLSGTGINGVVYELINGVQTPVSGATVYINNGTTWSSQMTTGSNGYYQFDNLNVTTYYVYAVKKDYQQSQTEIITTVSGLYTTRDILLKPAEPTWFEPDKHYVKFQVRKMWCITSCEWPGVTVTVYKSGEVTSYANGNTDSTGTVSFLLFKTQLYRVTAVNTTLNINKEITIYPIDTEYIIFTEGDDNPWNEHETEEKDAINITVSKSTLNTTYAWINTTYSDSLSGTSLLWVYINQTNTSSPYNQTVISSWSTAAAPWSHNFSIANYSGQQFYVHFVATHSEYGTIDRTFYVFFEKSEGVGIAGIPDYIWTWFALGIMVFTGAIFTASTAEKGFLIVCAEGWIALMLGMFNSINVVQMGIALTFASVIAVFAYIKHSANKEGYV